MTAQTAETRKNFTRTWEARLYGSWGEGASASVLIATKILTVTADHEGTQTATIDGQPVELLEAYRVYKWASTEGRLTVLHEAELTPPEQPEPLKMPMQVIGKARAHTLHKIMGALGIPHAQHYGIAAFAIDEPFPLETLSTLTDAEAGRVWAYLCSHYPNACQVGQRIKAKTAAHAA
ncbi:hypothetical protein [Deinococcus fonticola]|uniref:hypothetical protein n=1 Tax=Deinococcus fonticola TaxID=2528713 RepID=UPI001074BB03|nr:hypothetical protein [Deinococcus fonticola]